ncbi:MAG: hypothetical protein V4689_13380 [Verrucomicrobiota bacterium]
MHLPTPQFSRLVTVLAFDLSDPSLDSMILAWDHITTRFINPIRHHREAAGRIESIRLLSIHDAVHAVFGSGGGYVFKRSAPDDSLGAALAATARASHDVLAAVFRSPSQQEDLKHTLEESLSLVSDARERVAGSLSGSQSAASYLLTFAPFIEKVREVVYENHEHPAAGFVSTPFPPIRSLVTRPHFHGGLQWRRSA